MIPLNKPKKEIVNEHYELVKSLIRKRIKSILAGHIRKDGKKIVLSPKIKSFLSDLQNDKFLEILVTCSSAKFQCIIKLINHRYPELQNLDSDIFHVAYNIFIRHCYDDEDFSKFDFIKNININTCPYCNRSYIFYLSKEDGIKPQIDHFFPKDKYPYLGVSFFNLIPSCQTCNGLEAKSNKDPIEEGMKNPYDISPDEIRFSFSLTSKFLERIISSDSIEIYLKINELSANVNVFKLESLYRKHEDHVIELIVKSKLKYTKSYKKYLSSYKNFILTEGEIDRMILGNYSKPEEVHKRPLAKLYQDIGKELGLIS